MNAHTPNAQTGITFRRARPTDKEAVLHFCQQIWNGHDYIPWVWDEWIADSKNYLYVGELGGKAISFVATRPMAEKEWWFQGFRVDPQHQGKKIGTLMMEYQLNEWLKIGQGVLRLTTDSDRIKVHHLCEKLGFKRIAERKFYSASTLVDVQTDNFTALKAEQLPQAAAFAAACETLSGQLGLVEMAWRYVTPSEHIFAEIASWPDGHLYWWKNKQGLLVIWEDEEPNEPTTAMLAFAGCNLKDLPEMLQDFRRLGAQLGHKQVGWRLVFGELIPLIKQAGFAEEEGVSEYVYEKQHPLRP